MKVKKVILFIIIIMTVSLFFKKIKFDKNMQFDDLMSKKKIVNLKVEKNTENTEKDKLNKKLPKLIDIGSGKCIPCKMMKPIIEDFKKNYTQFFQTEYIDLSITENREKAYFHKIRVIPTLIFLDEEGKELFRNEGYTSKEDIIHIWKKLNVKVD